mmetsp:Transcript_75846/g.126457  ORF Transcript_75846/g.126457 Transcript_75846/m.126457 type:complete len:92 (-) Transcript_75846:306-581(-)
MCWHAFFVPAVEQAGARLTIQAEAAAERWGMAAQEAPQTCRLAATPHPNATAEGSYCMSSLSLEVCGSCHTLQYCDSGRRIYQNIPVQSKR